MTRHDHRLCIATARESLAHLSGICSPHSPQGCCWAPPGHNKRGLRLEKYHPEMAEDHTLEGYAVRLRALADLPLRPGWSDCPAGHPEPGEFSVRELAQEGSRKRGERQVFARCRVCRGLWRIEDKTESEVLIIALRLQQIPIELA